MHTALIRRRRGGVAPYSPASLFANGEQGVWYEPSPTTCFTDTAGTTPAGVGDAVARINDLSGNGNHATQVTSGARPILRQSGGLYYLEFDGTDDGLLTGIISPGTRAAQIIAGFTKDSDAAIGTIAAQGTVFSPTGYGAFAPRETTNGQVGATQQISAYHNFVVNNASFDAPYGPAVGSFLFDSAVASINIRLNGALAGSDTASAQAGNFPDDEISIGALHNGSAFTVHFSGDIFAIIVRNGVALTSEQIASAESYIAAKTGVTL